MDGDEGKKNTLFCVGALKGVSLASSGLYDGDDRIVNCYNARTKTVRDLSSVMRTF